MRTSHAAMALGITLVSLAGPAGPASPARSESVPGWFDKALTRPKEMKSFGAVERAVPARLPDFTLSAPESRGPNVGSWQESTVIVYDAHGFGSGALLSGDGWFLTNYHVVADAAQRAAEKGVSPVTMGVITCQVENGRVKRRNKPVDAVLYRVDPARDLALLKMKSLPEGVSAMPHFAFSDTEAVAGNDCFVIGSQGGGLPWGVRTGTVSGIYKFPSDMTEFLVYASKDEEFFQRDEFLLIGSTCSISNGDSGGPLLDENGKLIGLTESTPTNRSGGSVGYHVDLSELKSFAGTLPTSVEAVPLDPWTGGIAHSFLTRPAAEIFEVEGERVRGLGLAHCMDSDGGKPVVAAAQIFLDFNYTGESDMKDLVSLMPSGLWGMEGKGHFPFDVFVLYNVQDSTTAFGYTNPNHVVDEIRIDLNRDQSSDVTWRRDESGQWKLNMDGKSPLFAVDRIGEKDGRAMMAVLKKISEEQSAGRDSTTH